MGTYAEGLVRDVRTHGLDRTIQARTARVISHAAFALARRLDRGGQRGTVAWRAVWRLHRAAATRADRLTGLLPPDQRIDLADQLRGAWQWLASRIITRPVGEEGTDREPGRVRSLMERGFETIKRAYHAAADRIGDLAQHPLWRRVTSAFESAQEVMDRAWLGVHRLSADDATLGTGRMLWVRTVELISHGIRTLLDRLQRGGDGSGLRWDALRVLHHAAEEHISHLRGYLPEEQNTPLGTYYDPAPAAQQAQTTAAAEPEAAQASPLPQRRRVPDAPAAGPAAATNQRPQQRPEAAPDQRSVTQKALAVQAERLRDRGRLAAAAATSPTEQRKAEMLLELADKSQAAALKMAEPPAPPREGALMAEPFLAALRVHAAARGAALPDDVIHTAWAAAVKATATAQRPAAQPQSPAAKSPKKERERPQRHAQEEIHPRHQHNTPSTPGRR